LPRGIHTSTAGLADGNPCGHVRSTSWGNTGLAARTMLRAEDWSMTDFGFGTGAGRLDATITEFELKPVRCWHRALDDGV